MNNLFNDPDYDDREDAPRHPEYEFIHAIEKDPFSGEVYTKSIPIKKCTTNYFNRHKEEYQV